MEMTDINFRKAMAELLLRDKIIVATVRQGSHYPEVEQTAKTSEPVRIEVSQEDRDKAFHKIASIVDLWFGDRS